MKKITFGLLVLAPLALASCDMFKAPEAKNLDGTVVEGKLTSDGAGKKTLTTSAWTGGAGQVILKNSVNGGPAEEVARTALTTDGTFNFAELPLLADKYLSNITVGDRPNCTSTLVVSDKTARGGSVQLTVDADKGTDKDGAIFVYTDKSTNKVISPTYFDKAVSFKGQIKCGAGGDIISNYDMNFKAGWNAFQFSIEGNVITYTTADSYRGQKWTLLTNSASPMALKTQGLFSQR